MYLHYELQLQLCYNVGCLLFGVAGPDALVGSVGSAGRLGGAGAHGQILRLAVAVAFVGGLTVRQWTQSL